MQTARRPLFMLSTVGALLVSACTSPNPRLYTLAPVPGTPERGGPRVVVLRQIAIARYLERPGIVRSSDNYRIVVMPNDTWGEPLGAMIGRVLDEDLSQRLPGSTIINTTGAITAKEDASVEVNIRRMDLDAAGMLAFVAQTAVVFTEPRRLEQTDAVRALVSPGSPALVDEVQAMSIAIGRLADEIARMLRQTGGGRR